MTKEERYQASAEEILRLVGGKENIISAAHCATRLRLVLKDEAKADVDGILKVDLVKGQFANGGQFQIIIGSGTVNEVYKRFIEAGGIAEATKSEVKQAAVQKMNPLQRLVKTLSDVFVPLIPALVASGLMMGLNNVLTANGLFISGKSLVEAYPALSDIASMINTFASAAYAFLPILIGFSATKMFGGNPYLGAVIGMIMVSGDLLNAYAYGTAVTEGTIPVWNIFGLTIEKVGYQGTVLPVLAASYILSFVEKKLHKYIPEILDNLLTPLLTVMITGFVTFTVVGGVMRTAGDMLTNSFVWMHDTLGIVGGMVLGFLYSPLTMTGMHHSLLPVDIQMVAAGGSFLLAIASCNNVAQGGATLCAMLRTKDKKLKSVAATSGVSAMLGITEPAMFGVNLKLKYPFYGAMVGAALGGGYVTLTNVLNTAPGTAGIVGFVCVPASSMLNFLIGAAISIAAGFFFTYLMSNMKKFNKELESREAEKKEFDRTEENNVICSPLTGTAIPMSEVPDDTFAAEVLGKGMAVIPSEGKVVAPCEGEVSTLFDTKHAIGISAKNGAELLIHVGVNTVELEGKYYKAHVAQGDHVKPGQLLLTFDIQKIQEAGYPVATPVIIANTEDYKAVEGLKTGEIHCMEPLMKLEEA
ncbi:MAG: sucrose-specific PTS transporter subunit IIBC [Eubacterium sp.]|nr:sucrose-specific PTS transporter subunit IIBC [Eubacterium sp.]